MAEEDADSSDTERYERCVRAARRYQAKFGVRTMSSEELLRVIHTEPEAYSGWLVVDVRTIPERSVSQIPGSITLAECHERLRRSQRRTVVAYCTVGYRSGLEATDIQEMYPESAVYNLDGILAYSHGALKFVEKISDGQEVGVCQTLCSMDQVHCFGAQWAIMAPATMSTTHFGGVELAGRLVQVGWMRLSRSAKQLKRSGLRRLRCQLAPAARERNR
jgi:rhodanese-related sulfurtransferase